MDYELQTLLVLFIGVLFHIAMFIGVRFIKNTKQLRKSLLIIIPNVALNAAILFFLFYSGSTTFLPKEIGYDGQNAEKRVERLENYTRELDIYIKSSQRQFFMLIGILFILYTIPLVTITLALTEPKKSETIGS